MKEQGRRVVHLGDAAGVGRDLVTALNDLSSWAALHQTFPGYGSRLPQGLHAAALPARSLLTAAISSGVRYRARPDVLHLHWARLAPLIRPGTTPLVVHAHGTDVRGREESRSGRVVRAALNRADVVIGSTPDLLADLPESAIYLPNPVDTDFFAEHQPDRTNQTVPTVLFFARWDPVKGAEIMLEAARILGQHKDVRLTGFDAGLHSVSAKTAGVHMLTPTDRAGVRRYLNESTVVIGQQALQVISRSETEAMACGIPVVMDIDTRLYGNNRPPVVQARGGEAIAEATLDLLSNDETRRHAGERGRDFINDIHSYRAVTKRLVEIYESMIT